MRAAGSQGSKGDRGSNQFGRGLSCGGRGGRRGGDCLAQSEETPGPVYVLPPSVIYLPPSAFLAPDEARCLFAELDLHTSWQKRAIMVRDRTSGNRFEALEGRPTVSFSLPPGRRYSYSGAERQGEVFPECVLRVKSQLEEVFSDELGAWSRETGREPTFNFCLANKYENGWQSVGKHSDNEPDIVRGSPIASVSLGAERLFVFEDMADPSRVFSHMLESGSALLMLAPTQERYVHSIPRRKAVKNARISLTFRINHNDAEAWDEARVRP